MSLTLNANPEVGLGNLPPPDVPSLPEPFTVGATASLQSGYNAAEGRHLQIRNSEIGGGCQSTADVPLGCRGLSPVLERDSSHGTGQIIQGGRPMQNRRRRAFYSSTYRRTALPQKPARPTPLATPGSAGAHTLASDAGPVLDQAAEAFHQGAFSSLARANRPGRGSMPIGRQLPDVRSAC
jgi:hypothetical protein